MYIHKLFYKLLFVSALITSILCFSHCDDKEPVQSEEEKYLQQLSTTWKVDQVKLDNEDVTSFFSTMTLTLKGDKTYSVANGNAPIWPASGTFTLEKIPGGNHFKLLRNDGVTITITELSENLLKYTFTYTASGGRTKGVSGVYAFSMSKKS